jgi:hypothetical protein
MAFPRNPDGALREERWTQVARQHVDEVAAERAWEEGTKVSLKEAVSDALEMLSHDAVIPVRRSDRGLEHAGIYRVSAGVEPPSIPNSFVREGDFWSLTYEDVVVRVKDTKGVRDIARLLAVPGKRSCCRRLAERPASARIRRSRCGELTWPGDRGRRRGSTRRGGAGAIPIPTRRP